MYCYDSKVFRGGLGVRTECICEWIPYLVELTSIKPWMMGLLFLSFQATLAKSTVQGGASRAKLVLEQLSVLWPAL